MVAGGGADTLAREAGTSFRIMSPKEDDVKGVVTSGQCFHRSTRSLSHNDDITSSSTPEQTNTVYGTMSSVKYWWQRWWHPKSSKLRLSPLSCRSHPLRHVTGSLSSSPPTCWGRPVEGRKKKIIILARHNDISFWCGIGALKALPAIFRRKAQKNICRCPCSNRSD